MKKKLSSLILALGLSTSPIFAKNSNRRAESKDFSKLEESKQVQKRFENSFVRQKRIELEKELIKETEQEISNVLSKDPKHLNRRQKSVIKKGFKPTLIVSDPIPANGIDISTAFKAISKG